MTASPAPRSEPAADPTVDRTGGRLLVAAAAVLWSSSGFFAKLPVFDDWPPHLRGVLFAFWRALFAGLFILPAVRRPRWRPKLLPMALCFAAMNATYLTALTLTTAANAIWLQSTAPWWVFLFGVIWLRQPPNRRDLIPLVLGLIGIGVILSHEFQGSSQLGVACGLASAVTYAAVVLFLRSLRDENAPWLVAVNHLVTAAVLLPVVIHFDVWPTGVQWPLLMAFGFVQMGLPYALFSRGLKRVTSQEATLIGLLEPVLLPIWAWLVAAEVPGAWTLAGAGLILSGLVLRYAVR